MQQSGMNYLYTKVSSVREQLILFASQMESLDREYNAVVAELEDSFVESKDFWERTTAEQKNTAQCGCCSGTTQRDGKWLKPA